MEKILFILSVIFTVLTFVGAIYVLTSDGTANAGYAVIPCAISLSFTNGFLWLKSKKNNDKQKE